MSIAKANLYVTIKLVFLYYHFIFHYSTAIRQIINGRCDKKQYSAAVAAMNRVYQLERKYHTWPMDVFEKIILRSIKGTIGNVIWHHACTWNLTVFMRMSLYPHDSNGNFITIHNDYITASNLLMQVVPEEYKKVCIANARDHTRLLYHVRDPS